MRLQQLAKQRKQKQARVVAYTPVFRGAALKIQSLDDQTFECILAGPAETGKTFAALWFVDRFLRKYPKARGIVLRKTQESLYKSVLQTYKGLIDKFGDIKPFGGQKPEWYDYPNGSRLYVGGLDKADKVLSAEFDIIYVNQAEELLLADWETLTTRATGRAGNAPVSYVIGDCNPSNSKHWILQRKDLLLLQSFHKDNPTLYDDDGRLTLRGKRSMKILDNLTGVRKLRLRDGKWSNAEGAIYNDYNSEVHLIDHFVPPLDWLRFRVIDFGFNNPLVVQWWAMDHDGRLYLYREIYITQTLVSDIALKIQEIERWYLTRPTGDIIDNPAREPIYASIADHDAEDRATLQRYGIDTIAAFKGVQLGIQAVQERLRLQTDDKPRLFFMRDTLVEVDPLLEEDRKPLCTVDEIENYVWEKIREDKPIKEQPIKKDDHGMDAMRYIVAYVDGVGNELEETITTVIYEEAITISPY